MRSPVPRRRMSVCIGRSCRSAVLAYTTSRLPQLLDAAAAAGEIRPDIDAYGLMRAIGSLCVGVDGGSRYDARRMVDLLIAGLRQSHQTSR